MTVTSITLFRFPGILTKMWAIGFGQLETRFHLANTREIKFSKLLGTGTRDGFHPYPKFSVYGILAVWPSFEAAQEGIRSSQAFKRPRKLASEDWTLYMSASRCRGLWSGKSPFGDSNNNKKLYEGCGLTAVLTRATIKARHIPDFWRQVPAISRDISEHQGMLFKIGLGEIPWLHQATFTVWRDNVALDNFAYQGAHGAAVGKVHAGDWFKEQLFARFDVLGAEGHWQDADELAELATISDYSIGPNKLQQSFHKTKELYRPPAPIPTTPRRALLRGIFSPQRDLLSLMPDFAYRTHISTVGRTRRKILLVNDPDLVRIIMDKAVGKFPKSDLMVGALAPLVRDSVFVSHGDTWERQRRMISPAFSHMRLNHAFNAMEEAVNQYEQVLDTHAITGSVFSLEESMSYLTADVVCRTIFSRPLDTGTARQVYDSFAVFQDSVANVRVMNLVLGRAFDEIKQPREVIRSAANIRLNVGKMVDERLNDNTDAYSDIAGDIIAARDPVDGSKFSREELIDQIGVFFLAGHETTAGALAWALFILSQQPSIVDRMREEIKLHQESSGLDIDCVKKLNFVRNVFKETLRLYPPLAFMPRVALEPGRIGDEAFPRGALIMISPWLIHRHYKLWENADRFDPDRFDRESDQESISSAYLPFGMGPRICIGSAFALIEATLILARLIDRYDFHATDPARVKPAARLTTRSSNGISAYINLRR